jgi:hypothetical protein
LTPDGHGFSCGRPFFQGSGNGMRISIIVPGFNGEKLLPSTLTAVSAGKEKACNHPAQAHNRPRFGQ